MGDGGRNCEETAGRQRNETHQEIQHQAEEEDEELEKLMNAWAKKYEGGKHEETATQTRKEISQETQHPAEQEDGDDAAEEEDDEIEQLMNAWAKKYDGRNCEETKTQK